MKERCNNASGRQGGFSRRLFLVCSIAALAATFAARIYGAWIYAYDTNADYGIVVLMVRHIVAGIDFPVFFYGQGYMGSFEPLASAALALLFGPTPFVVCLGTALLSFLMSVAVFRLANKIAGPTASLIAVAICAIGPFVFFQYMSSPRGGYAFGLLFTVLFIHEAVFFGDGDSGESGRSLVPGFFRFGLMAGLAFWNFWLVAPAVAAAGVLILWRMRLRVFRPAPLGSAIGGFAIGSFPWWWYFISNFGESLNMPSEPYTYSSLGEVAKILFRERIPSLLEYYPGPQYDRLSIAIAVALIVIAVLGLVLGFRPGRAPLFRRLSAAYAIYIALFMVMYVGSSLLATNTARYLLPVIPLCAVWIGCGIAVLVDEGCPGRGKLRGLRIFELSAAVVGFALVSVSVWLGCKSLPEHRSNVEKRGFFGSAIELTKNPAATTQPIYGEFVMFGLNWATDEKCCIVSPKMWRYHPYLERAEMAESPGVLENMEGFSHFLMATGTDAVYERAGRLRYHHDAKPPETLAKPLPQISIASAVDNNGKNCLGSLFDFNGETYALLRPEHGSGTCKLKVKLSEPQTVSGLRLIARESSCLDSAVVLGRSGEGDDWHKLSDNLQQRGFFWSGRRFFFRGVNQRMEILFGSQSRKIAELEIVLELKSDNLELCVETLQVLVPGQPLADINVAKVADSIRGNGIERVFADRWYANKMHQTLGGEIWTLRDDAITREDQDWAASIPIAPTTAIAVPACEVSAVEGALSYAGVEYGSWEAGGMTVFHLSGAASRPDLAKHLKFYGGGVFCNDAKVSGLDVVPGTAAEFPEIGLHLLGVSGFEQTTGRTPVAVVRLEWEIDENFRAAAKQKFLFIHVMDSTGKIRFQIDSPFSFDRFFLSGISMKRGSTTYRLQAPAGLPEGEYEVALGIWRPGLLTKRMAVESETMPVIENRIRLPFKVQIGE